MQSITLIQKEALTLKITVKDKSTGQVVNVLGATITFYCKDDLKSSSSRFTVNDSSIDKSKGDEGIIRIPLTSENLNFSGTAYGLLKLEFSSSNIRKAIFQMFVTAAPE